MLVKGDKIKAVKQMGFIEVGEVCEVVDVGDYADKHDVIKFKFGNGLHLGIMSFDEFEEYFEKVEHTIKVLPCLDGDKLDCLMENAEIDIHTVFDKCCILSCKLPNGYVIVESESSITPEDYNEYTLAEICYNRIMDRLEEFELYKLHDELNSNCCERDNNECSNNPKYTGVHEHN